MTRNEMMDMNAEFVDKQKEALRRLYNEGYIRIEFSPDGIVKLTCSLFGKNGEGVLDDFESCLIVAQTLIEMAKGLLSQYNQGSLSGDVEDVFRQIVDHIQTHDAMTPGIPADRIH